MENMFFESMGQGGETSTSILWAVSDDPQDIDGESTSSAEDILWGELALQHNSLVEICNQQEINAGVLEIKSIQMVNTKTPFPKSHALFNCKHFHSLSLL